MRDSVVYLGAAEDEIIRDVRRLNAAKLRKLASLLEEVDREGFANIAVTLRRMADDKEKADA